MYTKQLADKTRYYKETPEGVGYMCKAIEEMRNKAVLEDKLESALKMIADGSIPLEKIAVFLGLNLEDVQELANSVASNT